MIAEACAGLLLPLALSRKVGRRDENGTGQFKSKEGTDAPSLAADSLIVVLANSHSMHAITRPHMSLNDSSAWSSSH
jgi:hypothetical protein